MPSTPSGSLAAMIDALCEDAQPGAAGALASLAAACDDARAAPGRAGLGRAALAYGAVLLHTGDGDAALRALAEADEAARADDDPAVGLQVLVSRSKALTITGDLQGALECFREGLDLARGLGDRHTEAVLLSNLGFFHGQLEESVPYEEYTRIALAMFRELGDPRRVALCLNNLAGAITRRRRFDEALACYEEALPLALALGWRRGQALILAGHGGVHGLRGEVDDAARRYCESNAILEGLGDFFHVTRHEVLLGRSMLEAGRPAEALGYLDAAVGRAAARRYELELSQALDLSARAHEALGDAPAALRALRWHVEVRDAAGRRQTEEAVRKLKIEHRLSVARRDAELKESRNAELAAVNAALVAALAQQRALQAELERLASTDPLTGLANRRFANELGERDIARCRRSSRPLAVLLADLDHFKDINDRHGHAVGDEVLVEMAARLRRNVRTVDLVARWGGEEFCLLLVDTDVAGALVVAARLRAAVGPAPVETSAGPITVTLSQGVAGLRGDGEGLAGLLARADAAMYEAKHLGRDRFVVA